MNIIVCLKQVPDTETRIKINDGGKGIARDNVKHIISPFDEFALEEAVRIKEAKGGTVTALTLGPDRAKEALRSALAVGADKAVHISDAGLAGADSLGVAKALAAAIKQLGADLVLFGKKAAGLDRGQVPAQVAAILGWSFVSQAVDVAVADDASLTVERETEGGSETFAVRLPAVVAREKNANKLRNAALKGIMAAKSKPIQGLDLGALGLGSVAPHVTVSTMEYPAERAPGRIIGGDAAAAARELVRLLHDEAKVI